MAKAKSDQNRSLVKLGESLSEIVELITRIREIYPQMSDDNIVDIAKLVVQNQFYIDLVGTAESLH